MRVFLKGIRDRASDRTSDCDAVCFPVHAPSPNKMRRCAAYIRRRTTGLPAIMGGSQVSMFPDTVPDTCDLAVRCGGDGVLPELPACRAAGSDSRGLAGVSFIKGGEVHHSPTRVPPAGPDIDPELSRRPAVRPPAALPAADADAGTGGCDTCRHRPARRHVSRRPLSMNRHLTCRLLSLSLAPAVAALLLSTDARGLDLVAEGRPVATIVIPDEALPVVRAAAEELQYHVGKSAGAELPIVKASAAPEGPGLVFLGPCPQTARLGLNVTALEPNGSFIRTVDGNLHLLGDDTDGQPFWVQHENRTRVGTLFAVYEILEKDLGVRWLWPGPLGEVIPRHESITLSPIDRTPTPPFVHTRWRDGGTYSAGAQGWASQTTRSRFLNEQGKWLRRHRFAMGINMDMAHSYTDWWERFGPEHPEYFNLLPDGTRRSDPTYHGAAPSLISMCVGEPGVRRQKIEDWLARRSPQKPYIDASENDTPGKCTCPLCMAMDVPDPESPVPFAERLQEAEKAFARGEPEWPQALGSLSDRYARFYLALQEEARKIDPDAVVMGYAYANYVRPPRETRLNPNIIIGIVPALMFPWTEQKRKAFIEQWEGWSATGARLLLRPNYMLDGHCLPINFARALGEDLSFAIRHGLIGTDFDSLTGQYATQGLNLYMLARLHGDPALEPEAIMEEFLTAFGPATGQVRDYFAHWEDISRQATDEQVGHWASFYKEADGLFTEAAMSRGQDLLSRAVLAAEGDAGATARVEFLSKGLRHAELVLATQRAYRDYKQTGELAPYARALETLDEFRALTEGDLIANMAYLSWSEASTWDRALVKLMATPGRELPDTWLLSWDPERIGEAQRLFAEDSDTASWLPVGINSPWEEQEVGRRWEQEHGRPFDGIAWYRNRFSLEPEDAGRQVRLVFGAVDEACRVWVNGEQLLDRPYPYRGNPNSWQEAFEVDVTETVRFDRPNTLVVRVEDNTGAGGIFKPVWIVVADAPAPAESNLIADGTFEDGPGEWKQSIMCGTFDLAIDDTVARTGRASARVRCTALGNEDDGRRLRTRAWGRWHRAVAPMAQDTTYRLRAWVRTAPGFAGTVRVWVTGTTGQTLEARMLNTDGIWRQVTVPDIVPAGDGVGLYLNLFDATGTVWFDDLELQAQD